MQRTWSRRAIIAALAIFFVVLAFGGGASRFDVQSQMFVRVSAIVAVASILIIAPPSLRHIIRVPLLLLGALAVIMLVQLVPLPPAWWTALPGRALYADAADVIGMAQPWRPISLTPDLTLNSLLAVLPPLAALLGTATLERSRQGWTIAALAALIAVSGILGMFQFADGPASVLRTYRITNNDVGTGLFANRNHNALLLAIGVPLTLWLATRRPRRPIYAGVRYGISAAVLAFLLVSIMVTGSRAGIALAAIGLVGGMLLLWREGVFARVDRRLIGGGAALAAAAIAVAALQTVRFERFSAATIEGDSRLMLLPDVLATVRRFFPVGAGFGSFDPVFRAQERPETLTPSYINHAHNDAFEIVIESGVAGALMLLAALLLFTRASWQVWRSPIRGSTTLGLARLATIIIAMIAMHSLTDYPLRTPIMASILALTSCWLAWGFASSRDAISYGGRSAGARSSLYAQRAAAYRRRDPSVNCSEAL